MFTHTVHGKRALGIHPGFLTFHRSMGQGTIVYDGPSGEMRQTRQIIFRTSSSPESSPAAASSSMIRSHQRGQKH